MSKLDSKQIMEITKIDPTEILMDGMGIVENTVERLAKFPNEPFSAKEDLSAFHEILRLGEFASLKEKSFGAKAMDLMPLAPLLSPSVMTMYGYTDFSIREPSHRRKTVDAIDFIANVAKKAIKKATKTEEDEILLACAGGLFSLAESVFEHTLHRLQRIPALSKRESLIEKEGAEEFEGSSEMMQIGAESEQGIKTIANDSFTFLETAPIENEEGGLTNDLEMFTLQIGNLLGKLTSPDQLCPRVFGKVINNEFKTKYKTSPINDEDVNIRFETERKAAILTKDPFPHIMTPTGLISSTSEEMKRDILETMIQSDFKQFYENVITEANGLYTTYLNPTAEEIRQLTEKSSNKEEDFSDIIRKIR